MNPPSHTAPPFASENERYAYPLTAESVVVDAGCYQGQWAAEIFRRYGCRIFAFEPCTRFFEHCEAVLAPFRPRVQVFNLALGANSGPRTLHVQGDSTGFFAGSPDVEKVTVSDISNIFPAFSIRYVDLLKLNCEGSEYEILEALIARNETRRFGNIQVQFHRIGEDYERRYAEIRAGLAKTHEMQWGTEYVWESWRLKQ